jgi:hypothetical protein
VRYNLRLLPWYIWPLVVIISLLQAQMTQITNTWEIGRFNTTQFRGVSIFFCAVIGSAFFRAGTGHAGGQIPEREFLLSRPIRLRTAYLSRMAVYFILMLAAPLSEVYVASAKPGLRVEFYPWKDQSTETTDRLRFYQQQFPDSAVDYKPRTGVRKEASDATLSIPFGALLIAFWDLIVVIVFAFALQMAMSFVSPSKGRVMNFYVMVCLTYFFVSVLIDMMFPHLLDHTTMYEYAFFFFTHHWLMFALFTLGAFILVQCIVLKRIQEVEEEKGTATF